MSGNELIAEFMGEEISAVTSNHEEPIRVFVLPKKPISKHKTGRPIEALYTSSWDWLMPVVEKIETLYDTGIFYDGNRQPDVHNIRIYAKRGGSDTIVISYGKSKIETIYRAVIEFIKWYNQQKL